MEDRRQPAQMGNTVYGWGIVHVSKLEHFGGR
jgi:hypothetical protein